VALGFPETIECWLEDSGVGIENSKSGLHVATALLDGDKNQRYGDLGLPLLSLVPAAQGAYYGGFKRCFGLCLRQASGGPLCSQTWEPRSMVFFPPRYRFKRFNHLKLKYQVLQSAFSVCFCILLYRHSLRFLGS
jgi:hypothetical protein